MLIEFDGDQKNVEELIQRSRSYIRETQAFIENNKPVIPTYILKKISDSLSKLEQRIDEKNKSRFKFKFTSKTHTDHKPDTVVTPHNAKGTCTETPEASSKVQLPQSIPEGQKGFLGKEGEDLLLQGDEVDSKAISLVNLNRCNVKIHGFADTAYIANLKDCQVEVFIASRSVTVRNCVDCKFTLMCQQLRVDSCKKSNFTIFTSAESMLEGSADLSIGMLKPDIDGTQVGQSTLHDLMLRAKFDWSQNKWRCIRDFDCLTFSTDKPSNNFRFVED